MRFRLLVSVGLEVMVGFCTLCDGCRDEGVFQLDYNILTSFFLYQLVQDEEHSLNWVRFWPSSGALFRFDQALNLKLPVIFSCQGIT